MASPEDGDDDRPPSNPPPHAGDQHTHRPNLDLLPLPPQIHSKARPSSSTVLPENTIVLALSGHTSELPTPSLPPHDTNRPPKTKKNQSKTKPSSRVPFPPTVDAVPPTLPTSGDAQQLLTIPANQPCNELTMPTLAASGSGNISPRQSQLHIASAQLPVAVQGHSSLEEPTHDDLNQPSYAQNNEFAAPLLAAPGSSNSYPRPVQLRSAAEQVPAAITDQPGLREPVHDDLNQPPNCQFPEPTLAAAAETSSRAEFISTLTASIAAAVDAFLRPNSSPPTSTSPIQPIPPMTDHSPAAAKETHQPALKSQTSQNPNIHPFPPITTRAHDQTRTHPPNHQIRTHHLNNPTNLQAQQPISFNSLHQAQQPPLFNPLHQAQNKNNFQAQQQTNKSLEQQSKPNPVFKKPSYANVTNPAHILNPNAPTHPKSFVDTVAGVSTTIPPKPISLVRGEPAVHFSAAEIQTMAEPFKLSLVGKFSFGRPPMELIRKFFVSLGLKGNCQISLLDSRHVLIKLVLEEDYSRIWLRQTWFINGRGMRVFKWSTDFRCSVESPIVPVWVSLPHLPVHFIHCKSALCSIASAIGTPLRVDHATASVTRPTVARVLVEYDVSKPLLPRIWIGEGESGFWQDVVFERAPAYCATCKHLGHSVDSCYIANPELRKTQPAAGAQSRDEGKMKKSDTVIQPQQPSTTRFVVISDHRTQGPSTQPPVDPSPAPPLDESRPVDTSPPGAPLDHPASHPDDVSTSPGIIPVHTADHTQVGFNSHSTDIPDLDDGDGHRRLGLSRSTEEVPSDSDRELGDEGRFLTDSEEIHPPPAPDAVIESFDSERVASSSRDFSLVQGRRLRSHQRRMRHRSPTPDD
ncbi:hypothetical protein WN943_028257 [Citrus x changshan-huyou]